MLVVHLPETKKELINLCRLEIQILFTEMNLIRVVFNLIWLMLNQKIYKRTQSDKVLRDKTFKIASDTKYDGYQRGLASMVYKFFDKKSSGNGVATEPNYQFANELHRQIIRQLKRRKVYSSFRDNIWSVDLADMESLSKYNKGIKYLLCAIDLFNTYAWAVPLKDKRGISIVNAFQKMSKKGVNQIKYGFTRVVNFTIIFLGHF